MAAGVYSCEPDYTTVRVRGRVEDRNQMELSTSLAVCGFVFMFLCLREENHASQVIVAEIRQYRLLMNNSRCLRPAPPTLTKFFSKLLQRLARRSAGLGASVFPGRHRCPGLCMIKYAPEVTFCLVLWHWPLSQLPASVRLCYIDYLPHRPDKLRRKCWPPPRLFGLGKFSLKFRVV